MNSLGSSLTVLRTDAEPSVITGTGYRVAISMTKHLHSHMLFLRKEDRLWISSISKSYPRPDYRPDRLEIPSPIFAQSSSIFVFGL